ncbi:MAG: DUF349 domain-containing protein [Cytophagales bacterium]|nr:DUF349 domain-containing protein [Cytophagales bacterium]
MERNWASTGKATREKLYKEFKEACDFFFGQRREVLEKTDHDQDDNLKLKEAIIEELRGSAEGTGTLEKLHELQTRFNEIGFVPKNVIASVKSRFADATAKYLETIGGLNEAQKDQVALEDIQFGQS